MAMHKIVVAVTSICLVLLLYLLIKLIFYGANIKRGTCAAPFVRLNNGCYFVEQEEMHPSFDPYCYVTQNSSELSIDSVEEMHAIADYLIDLGFTDNTKFWTGGNKLNANDTFRWYDLTGDIYERDMRYTNWLPGEPDIVWTKNCLIVVLMHGVLYMKAENCRAVEYYICERELE